MTIPGIFLALKMSAGHDENLAVRLQRRDPEALGDLYDRFGRLAYSLIVAIVRDTDAADVLLEEAFLRAWNRARAFEPGRGALGPWVLAIARNRAIDYVRTQGLRDADVREHPSLFTGMEREVLDADHARVIRTALAKLSAEQRKVVELAYYEGLSQTEMAERMGSPPGAVRTWVREAVKQLREELGQTVTA
jgi:RNA polymerase sigma-70 factor, ECF subfamily